MRGIHLEMMNHIEEDVMRCNSAYPSSGVAWIFLSFRYGRYSSNGMDLIPSLKVSMSISTTAACALSLMGAHRLCFYCFLRLPWNLFFVTAGQSVL